MATIAELGVLLLLGILVLAFVFYFSLTSKAIRLRVRDPNNTSTYVRDYLMNEKVDRTTKVVWLQSVPWQKPKLRIPKPSEEVVDVGLKGRKFLECYKLSEDEVLWIKDGGLQNPEVREKIESFEPFSATQRETLANQYAKSEAQRKKSFLSPDVIVPLASISSLLILVVCLMIFWGDIAQPALESQKLANEMLQESARVERSLVRITSFIETGNFPQELREEVKRDLQEGEDERPPE